MKAFRIHGPLDMPLENVPTPEIGDDQVLVQVAVIGVCATDIELYDGRMPYIRQGLTKLPLTPGHEWSGRVAKIGRNVNHVRPGDPVVGDISLGCGKCVNCLRGAYHLCADRTELGVSREHGAFAEHLRTEAKNVYRIPAGLSLEEAAFAEPAATCVNAMARTRVNPGDNVAVFGDGVIGFLSAQTALVLGASKVVLVARKSEHAKVAEDLGLTLVDAAKVDVLKEVPRLLGGLPEVVCECTGNPTVLDTAVHLTAPGGRINALSITGKELIPIDIDYVVTRDITLVGSLASPNAFPPTLRLLVAGRIKVKPLVSRVFPFAKTVEAFDYVRLRQGPRIKVLVTTGVK